MEVKEVSTAVPRVNPLPFKLLTPASSRMRHETGKVVLFRPLKFPHCVCGPKPVLGTYLKQKGQTSEKLYNLRP